MRKVSECVQGVVYFLGCRSRVTCLYIIPLQQKNGNLKDFYFLTFQSGEGLDLIIKVKQRPKGSLFEAMSFKRG